VRNVKDQKDWGVAQQVKEPEWEMQRTGGGIDKVKNWSGKCEGREGLKNRSGKCKGGRG